MLYIVLGNTISSNRNRQTNTLAFLKYYDTRARVLLVKMYITYGGKSCELDNFIFRNLNHLFKNNFKRFSVGSK